MSQKKAHFIAMSDIALNDCNPKILALASVLAEMFILNCPDKQQKKAMRELSKLILSSLDFPRLKKPKFFAKKGRFYYAYAGPISGQITTALCPSNFVPNNFVVLTEKDLLEARTEINTFLNLSVIDNKRLKNSN